MSKLNSKQAKGSNNVSSANNIATIRNGDSTSYIMTKNEFDKQQVQNVIFSDLFCELFSEVMKSVTMRNYYYDSQYSLSLEKKNIKEIIVEDKDQLEEKK